MRVIISSVFLALAVAFLVDARSDVNLPIPEQVHVVREDLRLGPPRDALRDPPTIQNGRLRQTCQECHALFESPAEPRVPPLQHTHLVLDHGMNDSCYGCHQRENRDLLVLRQGRTVGYDHVEELCAQCHGTTFRDWQAGIHGRTIGWWDPPEGEVQRLVCTQCHDPHSPAYPRLEPLPGPNTMRMGAPDADQESHGEVDNPLERWKAVLRRGSEAEEHLGNEHEDRR